MTPIDVLPNDVLLVIFDFCVEQDAAQHLSEQYLFAKYTKKELEAWQSLVHVSTMEKCYFWVTTPPESATCLHSQNACKAHIQLDVWPALPLFIFCHDVYPVESADNIIAILERSDRVCRINLMNVQGLPLETVLLAMQEPFPELTHLLLWSDD